MGAMPLTRRADIADLDRFESLHAERAEVLRDLIGQDHTYAVLSEDEIVAIWGWARITTSVAEAWMTLGIAAAKGLPALRGLQQAMTESIKAGLTENPALTRVQAIIESNLADANFVEYLGFRFEGTVRGYFAGEDGWMYGATRDELMRSR